MAPAPSQPPVSALRVGAAELAVTGNGLAGMWTAPDGTRAHYAIGDIATLLPRIDALRGELRDPMAISTGQTPLLRDFAAGWGRAFLPPALANEVPDALVFVPHAVTHDLPFHVVQLGDSRPLGTVAGVTYASSRSLFLRTVERNAARRRDAAAWTPGIAAPTRSVVSGGIDVLGDLDPQFAETCRMVADSFGGERTVFLDPGFPYSRNAVKAGLRKKPPRSALCVMAHGWIDNDNHRMSGLLVARDPHGLVLRPIPLHGGRYFDFRDLPLRRRPADIATGHDIEVFTAAELEVDAQIDCELVMLLGCSAGWGRVLQGDEPASLAETWLKIGAASVVAPLWDAPIAAVRAWTAAFLHAWTQLDMPKALALRHAMRTMAEGEFANAPERFGVMTLRGDWL